MKNNKENLAVIYCRVSSDRQKNEGHGLESQEHRCREYAESKGYKVSKVFRDSFTGGGDFMDRPAMAEMLQYLEENMHKSHIVIFDDLKRFARDTIFHWNLRRQLEAVGANVECLNFTFEDTPEGEFIETIMAAQGELERKQNKRQVMQKQRARLEKGYWTFYPPPGYKHIKDPHHGKLLVKDEPIAGIIKEAYEGFANGRFLEQKDVQEFLQDHNFKKRVYLHAVKRLLTRPIYAGYIEYPKWEVSRRKGHHEPLISLETYEKVQEKLKKKRTVFSRKDKHEDFPLRGYICCHACGKTCTASWTKGRDKYYAYYRCKTFDCELKTKSISRKQIEKDFRLVLKEVQPMEQIVAMVEGITADIWEKREESIKNQKKAKQQDLASIEKEISVLTERIINAKSEKVARVYEDKLEVLQEKKEKLALEGEGAATTSEKSFRTALEEVLGFIKSPYKTWTEGTFNDKRLVLQLAFREPLVYEREVGFRTANLSLILELFEQIEQSKSRDVEVARLNPRVQEI